jgi:hypothetical protein
MQAQRILIFSILIIVIGLMSSGCTSTAPTPAQNSTPVSQGQAKVSLQQAIDALNIQHGSDPPLRLYYIRGVNLSPNGTAEEWTLGVMQGNMSYFFDYTGQKGTTVAWPEQFPYQEIKPGPFIKPDDLFQSHKLLIQDITRSGTFQIDELELIDGVYTLSISDNETTTYKFNAISGGEIN